MSFDVPKVVRSPGCDHGHDEESRNGRDMDIGSVPGEIVILPEYRRGYQNPPEAIGPYGPKWRKRRGGQGAAARPSPPPKSELDKEGGGAPLAFPLSHSFLPPSFLE